MAAPRAATPAKVSAAHKAAQAKAAAAELAALEAEVEEGPVRTPWTLPEDAVAPDGSPVRLFSPRDARGYEGQLYVRNNTPTQVCFDPGTGVVNVLKLARAGADGSVAALPQSAALNPGFQKFWGMGKVTVTNDPDIELEFEEYSEHAALAEREREAEVMRTVWVQQPSIAANFVPIPKFE